MRWASLVAGVKEKRNMYRILVRKPQGKGEIGARWEYNDKMVGFTLLIGHEGP
jgi:hypothetical protein